MTGGGSPTMRAHRLSSRRHRGGHAIAGARGFGPDRDFEEYVNSTLPKALGAFAAIHPGVEVTVRQETSMANSAALAAGELDIAVVFEPGGRSRNEVLMVNPTVWATCDQHGAHERRPVPIGPIPMPKAAGATNWPGGACRAAA